MLWPRNSYIINGRILKNVLFSNQFKPNVYGRISGSSINTLLYKAKCFFFRIKSTKCENNINKSINSAFYCKISFHGLCCDVTKNSGLFQSCFTTSMADPLPVHEIRTQYGLFIVVTLRSTLYAIFL